MAEIIYTPPAMLQDIDDNAIHARMMEALPQDIDNTEGGFAHEFTKPAAITAAEMMVQINEAIQIAFPAWSYDLWLDQIAGTVGLRRRSPTKASGNLTVTGTAGTVIPAGFLFSTPSASGEDNIEFEAAAKVAIPSSGSASVYVRALVPGIGGNVPANSITIMVTPIPGIATITNAAAFTGGAEEEDDESLRVRVMEREMQAESAGVGCIADYKRWAQEVDGVGTVSVVPEWQGAGTGTVKVIIMDSNGDPATQDLLDAVYNHIMSPDDEDLCKAPIGATVTVATCELLPISVSATVTIAPDATAQSVSNTFKTNFAKYLTEAKQDGLVRYTRTASILSGTEGIQDYSNLTIGGGTENITIAVEKYPSVGAVDLTVVSP